MIPVSLSGAFSDNKMAGGKKNDVRKEKKPVAVSAYSFLSSLAGASQGTNGVRVQVSQGPGGVYVHANGKAYRV